MKRSFVADPSRITLERSAPEPISAGRFFPDRFELDTPAMLEVERMLPGVTPEMPEMPAGMLAMIDPKANLDGFNASLKEAGVQLALAHRSGK